MGLIILFENDRFAAVDKPAGWLTIPSRIASADPRSCLATELRAQGRSVWVVHRLDAEASGLILFAKDADAHRAANAWFEKRTIHKLYEAWTEGDPANAECQEWRSHILRGKRRAYLHDRGKLAVTRATWVGTRTYRGASVQGWRLEPLTGRSHQLRFELARRGFPIVGDALYGATLPFIPGGIALRSVRLDFTECASAPGYGLPREVSAPGLEQTFDAGA